MMTMMMMMGRRMLMMRLLFFLVFFITGIQFICSYTDPADLAVLYSLRDSWQSKPPTWTKSSDPCGSQWEGVTCNSASKVTALGLSSMGITGKLPSEIGSLSQLTSLDLSFNKGLIGSNIPTQLGNLQNLRTLILAGCGLTGSIPDELGNLTQLTFFALNSNNLTGKIPPTLGKLINLDWLDVAENQLTGPLPVSTDNAPGLNLLLDARHFHFNKNNLSGPIPEKLFSSGMSLIHVLFDGNQLTGPIPPTLGLVQDLEALRLDRNMLTGEIPSNINKLTKLNELNLANNGLNGSIPDLSNMNSLNYVDLSNNSFNASEAPKWFSTLPSLNTLVIENGSLHGAIPPAIFSSALIQQVLLRNNEFSGTLNISLVSPQLDLIDVEDNQIQSLTFGSAYNRVLMLYGNPICDDNSKNLGAFCQLQQTAKTPYTTDISRCIPKTCSGFMRISPANCECQVPYQGTLTFRAPFFRDLTDANLFGQLEDSLSSNLTLPNDSAYLENPYFNSVNYIVITLLLFPSSGTYFSHSDIGRIGNMLSKNTFKPPELFGPYTFNAFGYPFPVNKGVFLSTGAIAGIAVSATILVLGLVALTLYAIRQKKRAEHAVELSKPFASWGSGGKDIAGAPQLKGARWFSFDELKKCTKGFSENNEIGAGGYGKVYRGTLSDGQVVAIKRAQQGSMQGGQEFRTEIELLSRVHHKNLVSLVGFCFEQGEQMLVYEFISNGTLRENLTGRSGISLDWKTRLQIALGSAKGLAYLHELANPPIIHRDIKTMNILLDENLTAKVADFGLSKLVSDSKAHVSTQVKGTLGYLDPEYYMTQQLTEKSDVYSFGVVMLELITSKLPIEKGKYIVREVRMAMDKKDEEYCGLRDLIDPSLRKIGYLTGFSKFLELAMQSVQESAVDRPTMNELVKEFELILQKDEVNINLVSASSSATDFGTSNVFPPKHPYDDDLARKDVGYSGSFDYSGGYNFSAKIEPK